MTTISIAALVLPPKEQLTPATVEAVEGQSRRPDRILVPGSVSDLSGALRGVGASGTDWVWILDAAVIPRPDALQAMLDVATCAAPVPALLASRVLTPSGAMDPASRAVAEVHNGERVLAALEQRTVPLRVARRGSLLLRGDIAPQLDPGDVLDRAPLWTARLLGRELGVLVPSSVAIRQVTAENGHPITLATAIRILRELPSKERLWFAAHFAEEAAARTGPRRRLISRQRRG